jgi:ribosomal protein L37AE/L43A
MRENISSPKRKNFSKRLAKNKISITNKYVCNKCNHHKSFIKNNGEIFCSKCKTKIKQ